jgi:hypothetical protein
MLLLYPNGALARSDNVPEGCIIVQEPPVRKVEDYIVDQTEAVLAAMRKDRDE